MATKSVATRKSSVPATVAKKAAVEKEMPTKEADTKSPATAPAKKMVAAKATEKKLKFANKKQKTIRDSFNMPADDYALISAMKKRAVTSGREMKKSELLRAGLNALAGMNEAAFTQAIGAVSVVKTGRPVEKQK